MIKSSQTRFADSFLMRPSSSVHGTLKTCRMTHDALLPTPADPRTFLSLYDHPLRADLFPAINLMCFTQSPFPSSDGPYEETSIGAIRGGTHLPNQRNRSMCSTWKILQVRDRVPSSRRKLGEI